MMLTNCDLVRQFEYTIYSNRNFAHLNLLPSGEMAASKFKSKIYMLYHNGVWYASKLQMKGSNAELPRTGRRIALLDTNSFLIYKGDEEAEFCASQMPLSEQTRFYCFVHTGKKIEVTIADRSRFNMGLRTSLPAGAGGCQILAMSFVALIREFDSKAANEMEQFWFGKGRDRKAKAEDPEIEEISDIEDIAKEPEG